MISAATTLLAIIAVIPPASADVLSNQTIPLSGTVVNACNGESVAYTGEEHLLFRLTLDQNGGTHLGFYQNASATGQGSITGAKYSLNFTDGGSANTSFPPPIRSRRYRTRTFSASETFLTSCFTQHTP